MTYLYCKQHGEEKLNNDYGASAKVFEGEYTKIVSGNLRSNYVCDKCNLDLAEGEEAFLFQFCLDSHIDYVENQYFDNPHVSFFPEKYELQFKRNERHESFTITEVLDIDHYFTEK
ncbi:hypothetical protein [Vibrio cionasavignyae]|uniref:hypothetical protein n=1 Tax=Vibrio cionasavignyae TaxID=2910252 RepID=UPI003D113EC4